MTTGGTTPLARVARVLRSHDLLADVRGPEDVVVSGVSQDSRTTEPGDLFLAWEGVTVDAHAFLRDAVEAGAVAAVVERLAEDVDIPLLVVRDGRLAAALAADTVLGSPGRELRLIGVTGTNGKTTTALLLRHLLGRDSETAAIGTLGVVGPEGISRPGTEGLTSPGPVEVATRLRELVDEGVDTVVVEASSHALDQRRLDALRFEAAVFTNLGRDHLDYHPDAESYRRAKLRLVDLLDEDGVAVVNADEPAWRDVPAPRRLTYGLDVQADVTAEGVELGPSGSAFDLGHEGNAEPVRLPLVGRFNVANALAAAATALALGASLPGVARALESAPPIPGRLESVVDDPVPVVIDFAHTPDALAGVLEALRPLVGGRLLVVFGAGGDRDRTKRRPMAEAVARRADVVVITSDNPRTEDPERILDDLAEGLREGTYERIADRREAIGWALDAAREGDLVLLAGKGHERYQVIGSERRAFDERVVVRELLGRRTSR